MSNENNRVQVNIKYRGVENTFKGTIEETWLHLSKFFGEFIPSFNIATKLELSVDLLKLSNDCEGLIAFSTEGANILVPKSKLTDNEALAMWLLANYLGKQLNKLNDDAFSKEEMQIKLGKSSKITSTRLGELVKSEWVQRTKNDKFKITTFGIMQMQKEVLPRIIAKTGI